MKKYIAMILTLVLALCLCACGNNEPTTEGKTPSQPKPTTSSTQPSSTTAPTESAPTAEEQEILKTYKNTVERLDTFKNFSDEVTMCYQILTSLDLTVIDKYLGTEYLPGVHWDYRTILSRITVLEDVLLEQKKTKIDKLGNETELTASSVTWNYDVNGRVAQIYNALYAFEFVNHSCTNVMGKREYTCDDSGRVTEIRFLSGSRVDYLIVLTYDDNGNKIKETVTNRFNTTYEILYTFDANNRLVKMENEDNRQVETYEYDANGVLVRSVQEDNKFNIKTVKTYQVGADGKILSAVYRMESYETWPEQKLRNYREDQYRFTYDDQGRMLKVEITYGATYDADGQVESEAFAYTTVYDFIYGDVCFYTDDE